ncbi:hypothetical protein PX554_17990 [Sphingomonas sp. H39-1-10]|uniref:hypothetical protein n=1 Tax=Sphingomonas pollutisoli TaxID=3030829 RepID=UPI0023BA312E|nr:hypothetical protein [Sphingomonas pollutisoli]MDF0490030.1 hypothetical protein [Sphingomonas pollutisoli]
MTFISEKPVKSVRKRHCCNACNKLIEVGEPAVNWCGVTDGQFDSSYYHPDCREAEVAYNRDCIETHWSDDWDRLCEAEHDNLPWIKEHWPIPYLRMCMTQAQWAAHNSQKARP